MQQALSLSTDGAGHTPQDPEDAAPPRLSRAGMVSRGSDDWSLASATLARAIDRLEEAVEQETAALRTRARVDLKDFNIRKSHGLLELTRAVRHFETGDLGGPLRVRLAELRAKLERNRVAIAVHLEAVREISTIMAEAMQEAESDGTYSEASVRTGLKP